jgi:hypothetical protein
MDRNHGDHAVAWDVVTNDVSQRRRVAHISRSADNLEAGDVGKALGEALAARGHDVVYGVRDPNRSEAKPATTVVDAIQDSEAVILATPYDATGPLLRENATALAGKIVIDATNPLKPDLSGLSLTGDVSGAELLQREAPSALLFKAFNTTGFGNMQNPVYPQGRQRPLMVVLSRIVWRMEDRPHEIGKRWTNARGFVRRVGLACFR